MGSWPGRARRAVPTSFWVAAAAQTFFLLALYASDGYDRARSHEEIRVVLTYLELLALFGGIHAGVRDARWRFRLTAIVYTLFVLVNFARYETAGSFDYGFAHENAKELLTPLGRRIVAANVRPWEVPAMLLAPLGLGLLAIARWPAQPFAAPRALRHLVVAGALVLLAGVPLLRISTHESLTGFATSALRFHVEARAASAALGDASYPFVHESVPSSEGRALAGSAAPRPHVILLFLESWSGRYTGTTRPDGIPITPVFDARRREGLTFEHFYGNSVQSSRGHFTTLCSLLPLIHGKELTDLPGTRLHCLPEVLKEHGYATSFTSATDEPFFDGANVWLSRAGFDDVGFAPPRAEHPEPALWGVGVQDDVFYRRFFDRLDAKVASAPGVPQLAVLANASNHYPFDKFPGHVPDPGYPTKYQRNYVASLRRSDGWLRTFYEELERRPAFRDAIVVLVSDHSFPADEHGIHFNGLGSFDEAFRSAFALRWPGHVAPEVVSSRAASQIDIAPTLLDLLQIRTATHFVGTSLVARGGSPPPVPCVQPYDGVHLAAIRWPLKLVRQESAEQEHLYDLAADPEEEHDLAAEPARAAEVTALRETFTRIRASEGVLRGDRVWPPPHR
ncbi:MAG: Phosphoglycerol transferase [Labilithrix sp.]|nr:Phosphoglycerol transferase [Labilithrix sp.]